MNIYDGIRLFFSGSNIIVMTNDDRTYIALISCNGLSRFPTCNKLDDGDYDENDCIRVSGVDVL